MADGYVETKWTVFGVTGASGVGKSSFLRMLLGQDPLTVHDSTPVKRASQQFERQVQTHLLRGDLANDLEVWEPLTQSKIIENLAKAIKDNNIQQMSEVTTGPEDHESGNASLQPVPHMSTNSLPNVCLSNDTVTSKHILELLPNVEKSRKLYETHWINAVDSGGQAAFLDLASALQRFYSSNVVVIRLDETLGANVRFFYSINGRRLGEEERRNVTSVDLVSQAFHAITACRPPLLDGTQVVEKIEKPCCIVVGTCYDLYSELGEEKETLDLKNTILCEKLKKFKSNRKDFKPAQGEIIFPFNTLSRDAGSEYKVRACRVRKIILSSYIKVNVPLHWFLFQNELMEKKQGGNAVVSYDECVQIGSQCNMADNMVHAALLFFHDVTMCLYYPDVLPHIVFIDSQPIFDWLTQLVAITFSSDGYEDFDSGTVLRLKNKGIFNEALIECLKSPNALIAAGDFLKLLIYLFVIVKIPNSLFFIPCVLQSIENPLEALLHVNGEPLFLSWGNDSPVPRGLFTFLVVNLIGHTEQFQLGCVEARRNKIELECVEFGGKLVLIDTIDWLGFKCTGPPHCYPGIYCIIHEGITSVCERLEWNMELSKPKPLAQCHYCDHKDEFHLAWFNTDYTTITCYKTDQCFLVDTPFVWIVEEATSGLPSKRRRIDNSAISETIPIVGDVSMVDDKTLSARDLVDVLRYTIEITDWFTLGLTLGLTNDQLERIQKDGHDEKECQRKMVSLWLDTGTASWRTLVRACHDPLVNKYEIAQRIYEQHHQGANYTQQ